MDREEFYQIGLSTGWLCKPYVCGSLSEVDRQIAVKAIAARATGTPAEAAAQILSGIAALDAGPSNPVVVRWPQGFDDHDYLIKRAGWHLVEADKLKRQHQGFVDSFTHRSHRHSLVPDQDPVSGNAPHHSRTEPLPAGIDRAPEALDLEPSKADRLQEPPLFGETTDASE